MQVRLDFNQDQSYSVQRWSTNLSCLSIQTDGWSGRGNQTFSPYVLTASPGGSSAGSGSAVGASLIPAALGTDTDGSINSPSTLKDSKQSRPHFLFL